MSYGDETGRAGQAGHQMRASLARAISIPIFCFAMSAMLQSGCEHVRPGTWNAPARKPRRLALLVGIGDYYQKAPGKGQIPWPKLQVEREIEEYRQVLIRDYQFSERDVSVLLDEKAKKQNILDAFEQHLFAQASPGDVVLFHFSGHGQRLPDDSDPAHLDEPDGMDESMVTYDSCDQSIQQGIKNNIRDDEFAEMLKKLAQKMRPAGASKVVGNITVTLDACFSGSATRGGLIARGRAWNVSQDGPLPVPRPDLPIEGPAGLFSAENTTHRDYTVVAAARADQTAWEQDGGGVFTHYWVRLLARADKTSLPTYRAAVNSLAIDLAKENFEQVPQVEGADDKLLFSGLSAPRQPADRALRAVRDREGKLWLSVGEVHDVTIGSQYELYAAGTPGPNAPLGLAEVAEVQDFRARLTPLPEERLREQPGVLAVEVRHNYGLSPLRVLLKGFGAEKDLRARMADFEMITVVGEGDEPAVAQVAHDLELRYIPSRRLVQIFSPWSFAPHAEISLASDERDTLKQRLIDEWRRKHFAGLRRDNPAARVELELIPLDVSKVNNDSRTSPSVLPSPSPAAHLELPLGKAFGMRLQNRSSRDLFAAALAISPDGEIKVLFGGEQPGKNRIRAGGVMSLPFDNPYVWTLNPDEKAGQRLIIKVIATESFVDFSSVETGTLRRSGSTTAPVYAPLQRLIEGLGAGVRSSTAVPSAMEWGTTDASVLLLPAAPLTLLLGPQEQRLQTHWGGDSWLDVARGRLLRSAARRTFCAFGRLAAAASATATRLLRRRRRWCRFGSRLRISAASLMQAGQAQNLPQ